MPLGKQLAREVWKLGFPDVEFDEDSSLADVFGAVRPRKRGLLANFLNERLRVSATTLPTHFGTWLSAPWKRIYTLNVDDLEEAVARSTSLPRQVRALTALPGLAAHQLAAGDLAVVHLNGMLADGVDALTFSHADYGHRLGRTDAWYEQLAADLLSSPIVFVGSLLEEPILWQHLVRRGARETGPEQRPKAFLVSPVLPLAKQRMLREYNVTWVKATAVEFADRVLAKLSEDCASGLETIRLRETRSTDSSSNIDRVAAAIASVRPERSLYLDGAEPDWSDLVYGRAIEREVDRELYQQVLELIDVKRAAGHGATSPVLVLTGTAGTGKR